MNNDARLRIIDGLVAEHIMFWRIEDRFRDGQTIPVWCNNDGADQMPTADWKPTRDASQAIRAQRLLLAFKDNYANNPHATLITERRQATAIICIDNQHYAASAPVPEEAICLAVLAVVGVVNQVPAPDEITTNSPQN